MRKLTILLICCQLLLSCEQVTKTIDETFKPNDTLVEKEKEKESPVPETTVNTQIDVQQIIKTALETHSVAHTHTEGKSVDLLTDIQGLEKAEESLRKLPQYAGKEIFISKRNIEKLKSGGVSREAKILSAVKTSKPNEKFSTYELELSFKNLADTEITSKTVITDAKPHKSQICGYL